MTLFDSHSNLAYSTVAVAPSPATSGLTLTVATGDGALFPSTGPFNVEAWPFGALPTNANAELIRVASRSGDVLTFSARGPQAGDPGGINRTIVIGDQIQLPATKKTLTDIETAVNLRAVAMFLG